MVRATLSGASFGVVEDANEIGPAVGLAGEGEALRIHEPGAEVFDSERIRIPLASNSHPAFIFVRQADRAACAFFNGEHVETIDQHFLSRRGAISAVLLALYKHVAHSQSVPMQHVAREINAYTKSIDDLPEGQDVPAGEPCEWPIAYSGDDEQPIDQPSEQPADDVNEEGDVECKTIDAAGENPSFTVVAEVKVEDGQIEIIGETIVPPTAEPACGEVVIDEAADRANAVRLYDQALAAAKDRYVEASQHRVGLQSAIKGAKEYEAEQLEAIDTIENRGWQYFMPDRKKSKPAGGSTASTTPTTDPTPAFPSHEPLPPPQAESEASAGASDPSAAPPTAAPTAFRADWQSVDIAELKLPKGTTTILREAGCETMGKLEAKRGSFDGLMGIAGIGETKKDAIEEAVLGWLSRNRDGAAINAVRERNREAVVAGESVALEAAAQSQG